MRKIIVLKGKSKTGKTTAIKQILRQIFEIEIHNVTKDLVLSFKFKDKLIAIITYGDLLSLIEDNFNSFNQNFDILVCACRTKGKTLKFYEDKRNDYDIRFIDKTVANDNEQEKIISEIREIIARE